MNFKNRATKGAVAALALLATTGCSVFGVQTVEEAPYRVISQSGDFEVRVYEPLVVVETEVDADYRAAGNEAFRKLFRYISGGNTTSEYIAMTAPVISNQTTDASSRDGEKVAMTAPVLYEQNGESWHYQFVLPASFTMHTAPIPLDDDVSLAEVPRQQMAVRTYAGRGTAKAAADNAAALEAWMAEHGLEATSSPRWAGYNPPWTLPPFRRNEVLIRIGGE